MMPVVEPPPATPLTAHVTDVSVAPATVAVNCWDCPTRSVELVGDTVTDTGVASLIVTEALPDLVLSSTLTARTVTVPAGTTEGAR